jgi:hypothetical protein
VDVSFSIGERAFREKLDELVLSKRPRRALAFFGLGTFGSILVIVIGAFFLHNNAVGLLEQLSFKPQAIEALARVTTAIIGIGTASLIGWSILAIQSVASRIGGEAV